VGGSFLFVEEMTHYAFDQMFKLAANVQQAYNNHD
jgi:hypothetical protein